LRFADDSENLETGSISVPPPIEAVKNWPLIGESLFQFWELASSNLKAAARYSRSLSEASRQHLARAAGSVGAAILQFVASVIIAGFLFSPGPLLVEAVSSFLHRRVSSRGDEFMQLAGATIRNVSQGVIGVSLLQALLAGIGLMAVGVPGASLIAFLVLILGLFKLARRLILLPVIIWSWITMETSTALIFTAYMVPVNFVDNILKPIIITRGLKTPMW